MKNLMICIIGFLMSGCASNQYQTPEHMNSMLIGTLGAIGGGIAGNQIGGGTGKIAATIAGTILGGALGAYMGSYMDHQDKANTNTVLETRPVGTTTSWSNPDTGGNFAVTPTNTFQTQSGQYCREFITDMQIGNEMQQVYGTACRQPDGSWQVVNQQPSQQRSYQPGKPQKFFNPNMGSF